MVYWEGHPRQFGSFLCTLLLDSDSQRYLALQFPYVLAFEPTFVEVRHVESGNMVQIIQGNNLRCLFAEAPPSTTHSASASITHTQAYHHQQNAYAMVDPRQSVYSVADRTSIMSSTSSNTLIPPGYGYAPRMPSRNHIIMVSDDRIMSLQLAPPPSPDTVSLRTQR